MSSRVWSWVVVTIAISFGGRLAYGLTPPQWTGLCSSGALLVGAVSIWLGFFPPAFHRARIEHAAAEAA